MVFQTLKYCGSILFFNCFPESDCSIFLILIRDLMRRLLEALIARLRDVNETVAAAAKTTLSTLWSTQPSALVCFINTF